MPPAAAKGLLVLLFDVGENMLAEVSSNRSAFEFAKMSLISLIERKIFSESKDELALILFGSKETQNPLNDDDPNFYQHIYLSRELGAVNWSLCEEADKLEPEYSVSGDFVEGLIVAADHLGKFTSGRKVKVGDSCVFVISNLGGGTSVEPDQIKAVIAGLNRNSVDVRFIGFNSAEKPPSNNFPGSSNEQPPAPMQGKAKSPAQLKAESIARQVILATDGESYSFEEAYSTLKIVQSRKVNPTAWKTTMEVAPGLNLAVQSYLKNKRATVKSWKLTELSSTIDQSNQPSTSQPSLNTEVKKQRDFQLTEGQEDRSVDRSELTKAFRYGTDVVHISEQVEENFKLPDNEKSFRVVAFCSAEEVSSHLYMGDGCHVVMADSSGGHAASVRFSAFVRALVEMKCVALVRKVYSRSSNPRVGVLVPQLGENGERDALYYIELPFSEELSMYNFAPLPISDAVEQIPDDPNFRERIHKKMLVHCPNEEQKQVIDDLIDNSMLPEEDSDTDGMFEPGQVHDPFIEHYYESVRQRILRPDLNEPLPNASDNLEIPEELNTDRRKRAVQHVSEVFDLIDRKFLADQEPSFDEGGEVIQGDVDVSSFLNRPLASEVTPASSGHPASTAVRNISQETPTEDFLIIARSRSLPFEEACEKLVSVVFTILGIEMGSARLTKCLQALLALRRQCVDHKRPDIFNNAVRDLFKRIEDIKFFASLIQNDGGLITFDESPHNGAVSPENALGFVDSVRSKGGNVTTSVNLTQENLPGPSAKVKGEVETSVNNDDARDLLDDL